MKSLIIFYETAHRRLRTISKKTIKQKMQSFKRLKLTHFLTIQTLKLKCVFLNEACFQIDTRLDARNKHNTLRFEWRKSLKLKRKNKCKSLFATYDSHTQTHTHMSALTNIERQKNRKTKRQEDTERQTHATIVSGNNIRGPWKKTFKNLIV